MGAALEVGALVNLTTFSLSPHWDATSSAADELLASALGAQLVTLDLTSLHWGLRVAPWFAGVGSQ